jgi:hypothetical protein
MGRGKFYQLICFVVERRIIDQDINFSISLCCFFYYFFASSFFTDIAAQHINIFDHIPSL